jgi:hypothetical protein
MIVKKKQYINVQVDPRLTKKTLLIYSSLTIKKNVLVILTISGMSFKFEYLGNIDVIF